MPADLKNPFNESCCDGGECTLNDMSAQSCGCDKGINYFCETHKLIPIKQDIHWILKRIQLVDDETKAVHSRLYSWSKS